MTLVPLKEYPFNVRPMVTAHRGDVSGGARENTIEAIQLALMSGAEMIEVDVQRSSDLEFFCYHDEFLPGSTLALSEMSASQLVSAGVTPLLSILELVRGRCYMNLEVKEYSARDPCDFMQSLESLIRRMEMQEFVLFSSFRPDYLQQAGWSIPTIIIQPSDAMATYFRARTPNPARIPERPETMLPSELMRASNATSYACEVGELTSERLADLQRHHTMLSVYTVTTKAEFDRVMECRVGGFVTDVPREAVKWRDEYVARHAS